MILSKMLKVVEAPKVVTADRSTPGTHRNLYFYTLAKDFAAMLDMNPKLVIIKWDDQEPTADSDHYDDLWSGVTSFVERDDPRDVPECIWSELVATLERRIDWRIQDISRAMVNDQVYANVTGLVEFSIRADSEGVRDAPVCFEDIPLYPDPVGEDWDGDRLAEAVKDYGYEWGDVLQNWAFLDPDNYRSDPVGEKWNANQCFVAIDEDMRDWDEVCVNVLGLEEGDPIPSTENIAGDVLASIRQWCKDEIDLPVAWPEPEDVDEIDLVDLRQGLADTGELEPREVFEWWIVSGWLAGRLEDAGEIVMDREYWGRQCTGQAICMDGLMLDIARESLDV